jgi:hypothetical protein
MRRISNELVEKIQSERENNRLYLNQRARQATDDTLPDSRVGWITCGEFCFRSRNRLFAAKVSLHSVDILLLKCSYLSDLTFVTLFRLRAGGISLVLSNGTVCAAVSVCRFG